MLRTIGWLLFSLTIMAITSNAQTAEEKKPKTQMRIVGSPGEIWMLPEVGMVAIAHDGKLTIEGISPANSRPKDYQSIDLQQGDIIMMANGKKITDTKIISALYDSLAIGQELKLGIKRGDQMMMATVKKADPATLPKRRMVVTDEKGGPNIETSGESHSIQFDDGVEDITPLSGTGLFVGTKGKEMIVAGLMPEAKEVLRDAAIEKGDIITKLQDKPVTTIANLEKDFDAIKIGEPVTITVMHGGKELKATFTKQESKFRTIIKKG